MTYIDRINVFGFKSYGSRKLTIPLGEGFIGIVGPNGSGKSNIGDAIVFALGLATAKSMRALKLTDLIFSSKGKTAPYAEVEIVFKNNGAFPLNTEEVSIYRRVDLNGKSTYKINGRVAKYYEIEELLSEAGIPRQAYNIITQGDIFRFIKMTPYERRELLSELAGINEYEEKKESAINDLKEIEEKLNSSKLVLKEIKVQLKRIEEEKESAEKAKYLEDKIKSLQIKLKGVKLFNLIKDKGRYIKELKNIENNLSSYFKDREDVKASQRETLEKIKQLESLLEEIQKELLPFKEKEGYINADINNLKIKKEDLLKQKEKLISERERYIKEKENKEREKQELKEKLKNLNEELKRINELLKENEKLLNEKSEEIKNLEEDGEGLQQKLIELEREEKALKESENLKEKEKIHIELEISKLNEREKDYKRELVSLKEKLKKLKQSLLNIEDFVEIQDKKIKSINNELKRLEVRKKILDKRLISLREKKEKLFHKLAEVLAKLSNLREDKISSFLKDISVAELITVKDNELIKAIEVAGGGRLKNIVVKDDRVAERCIRFLKEKKLGKASFIPLNRVRVSKPVRPPLKSGVLGLAIDFIDYPKEIEKAIFYVFGNTLVVEDFETARNVGIGTFRMTTVDGDLFEKSGVITG
ncbi:MAG: chromosome segregation protein SMC, partial [Persephonella sp.]